MPRMLRENGRQKCRAETVQQRPRSLSKRTGAQGDPVEIQEGKMEGDNISFVTVRKMGEMEMKSEWKGTVAGDEMKLTRTMVPPPGGFGPPPGGGAPGAGGPPPGAGAPGGAPAGGPGAGPGGGGRGMGGPTEIIAKRVK
jgi:hypothetical protein